MITLELIRVERASNWKWNIMERRQAAVCGGESEDGKENGNRERKYRTRIHGGVYSGNAQAECIGRIHTGKIHS